MSDQWVIVEYDWDAASRSKVYLAVTAGQQPSEGDWRPAFFDHVKDRRGKRVAVVRQQFAPPARPTVWVRDVDGVRRVRPFG